MVFAAESGTGVDWCMQKQGSHPTGRRGAGWSDAHGFGVRGPRPFPIGEKKKKRGVPAPSGEPRTRQPRVARSLLVTERCGCCPPTYARRTGCLPFALALPFAPAFAGVAGAVKRDAVHTLVTFSTVALAHRYDALHDCAELNGTPRCRLTPTPTLPVAFARRTHPATRERLWVFYNMG